MSFYSTILIMMITFTSVCLCPNSLNSVKAGLKIFWVQFQGLFFPFPLHLFQFNWFIALESRTFRKRFQHKIGFPFLKNTDLILSLSHTFPWPASLFFFYSSFSYTVPSVSRTCLCAIVCSPVLGSRVLQSVSKSILKVIVPQWLCHYEQAHTQV